ncbi:MAG TPA: immunoglobulin domain-containing protein, partial [Verrucomicrobiae bacterium]|nr:immunoglobulin domain-containing protein [Verrucomicrobiae bacterium]
MPRLLLALASLLCLQVFAGQPAAHAAVSVTNLVRNDFWDTDGTVHTVLATNGVVYVGGSFSYVAPRTKKIAALNAYTSESLPGFPSITGGTVGVIVPDENGGWYLAGDFTAVSGIPRTNLVHLFSDFSIDPAFAPNPNGVVRTLLLDGSTLYIGGSFSEVSGQGRSRLAALQSTDGTARPWNPGADGDVLALQLFENSVYVGGRFSQLGGQSRSGLAAVAPSDGSLLPWAPLLDAEVQTIGVNDDRIFVGGNFLSADGAARNGLAAFNRLTGQLVLSWDPNPRHGLAPGSVISLRVDCDTVYVGGRFTTIGGSLRTNVAVVDAQSGQASSWDAKIGPLRSNGLPSFVQSVEVSGNTVFIGGEFATASGLTRRDLIAVDATTGALTSWNPGLDGGIAALGVAGRTLLAAFETGPFGVERRNLAAFDETTGRVRNWNPNPDDAVLAMAVSGQTLFIGGSFSNVSGLPRRSLAALDANSGAAIPDWIANANAPVQALAASGNQLFVGGRFTTLSGITRRGLAAVDAENGLLLAGWSPHADGGVVHTLAEANGILYVGGSFTQLGFVDRSRLGALTASGGAVLPWNPGADGTVRALLPDGGVIYVGGQFITVAGQIVGGAAALDASSGQAIPWLSGTPSIEPDVRALAISGSVIYLGGAVLELAGERRFGVGAVQTNGAVLPWNPGVSQLNTVNALAISDRATYAGGGQGLAFEAGESKRSFAMFPQIGSPGWLTQPQDTITSQGGSVTLSALASSDSPVTYQWRFNGVDIPGETESSLVQTNAQLGGEGVYEVTASNALGDVTAQATLRVFVPVQIFAQPSAVFTTSGSNVTLSVGAMGNPPPLFHWRLNGVLIPGAVQSTLILGNATARSGGTYSVAVANSTGALLSESVSVTVLTNIVFFSDMFANRASIFGTAGTVRGDNFGATREDGSNEPRHAGKPGGSSVWLKWTAPANGIATFTTRGSGFDTLLGIYINGTLATLTEAASDEDRGGFLTSRASFNAQAGREYQIAIDGVGGSVGNIVLSWETEGNTSLPVIAAPPLSQTIAPGGTAVFSVSVAAPGALQYQWFFGCQALRGQTNAVLTLTNVQSRNVGLYRVMIVSQSGRVVDSLPAAL